MELPPISKMSKNNDGFTCRGGFRNNRGFTLIEMVLVLALVALIAIASITFSLPALGRFSCLQEIRAVTLAIERARHIAQFMKRGYVLLEITDDGYVIAQSREGEAPFLVDQVGRQSALPVTATDDIIFQNRVGAPAQNIGISVGGEGFLCHKTITINNAGAIL
ncbi:MAG: type II secretion system protein [Patescibacteria group bacterium]